MNRNHLLSGSLKLRSYVPSNLTNFLQIKLSCSANLMHLPIHHVSIWKQIFSSFFMYKYVLFQAGESKNVSSKCAIKLLNEICVFPIDHLLCIFFLQLWLQRVENIALSSIVIMAFHNTKAYKILKAQTAVWHAKSNKNYCN